MLSDAAASTRRTQSRPILPLALLAVKQNRPDYMTTTIIKHALIWRRSDSCFGAACNRTVPLAQGFEPPATFALSTYVSFCQACGRETRCEPPALHPFRA